MTGESDDSRLAGPIAFPKARQHERHRVVGGTLEISRLKGLRSRMCRCLLRVEGGLSIGSISQWQRLHMSIHRFSRWLGAAYKVVRYYGPLKNVSTLMRNLDLENTYRSYLERRGALGLDAAGNEVLVGLNLSESLEYIGVTNGSISSPLPTKFPDPQRFLELAQRHESARFHGVDPLYRLFAPHF